MLTDRQKKNLDTVLKDDLRLAFLMREINHGAFLNEEMEALNADFFESVFDSDMVSVFETTARGDCDPLDDWIGFDENGNLYTRTTAEYANDLRKIMDRVFDQIAIMYAENPSRLSDDIRQAIEDGKVSQEETA